MANLERCLLEKAAFCCATSQVDAHILATLAPGRQVATVPNGVDADFFCPAEERTGRSHITFIGQMDYAPNVQAATWLAHNVWPQVRRALPHSEFRIVGRNPTREVTGLRGIDGIRVVGGVPDVRPYLHDAVAVAPLQVARGIQNKVLEAMACAAPVVASPAAVQGLMADAAPPVIVVDAPEQWVSALARLLRSAADAEELGRQARQFILATHTWAAALAPLVNYLRELT